MGRNPRVHYEGAIYHVMGRGNGGQRIFVAEGDRERFLDILGESKLRYRFGVYAYCFMSNHFHVVIRVGKVPLSLVMQAMLTRYAKAFNSHNAVTGHLFQSRYQAVLCKDDTYLMELLRYIHLNPVRAGLAEGPSAWRWSGHNELLGWNRGRLIDAAFPLSLFGTNVDDARGAYSRFLVDGSAGQDEDGTAMTNIPRSIQLELDPSLESGGDGGDRQKCMQEIALAACDEFQVPLAALRGGSRIADVAYARAMFTVRAVSGGFRPSEIAGFLGCSPSAISKTMSRRKRSPVSQSLTPSRCG